MPLKMLPRGIVVLLILCFAAVPGILSHDTDDVDKIVEFCIKITDSFADIEDNFIRKSERSLKEPDLYFPQKKELKFRVHDIEKRQRPFECITNYLNGSYATLNKSEKYQNLVKKCEAGKFQPPECDPDYTYRTIDGTCNNLDNPTWGSVLGCGKRLLPAYYEGAADPRKSVCDNQELPSPRYVSTHYLDVKTNIDQLTSMHFLYFGQFIAHDIGDTPVTFVGDKPLDCCSNLENGDQHPQCAPILVDEDDHFYSKYHVTCQGFVRSSMCDTCSVGPRSQMGEPTTYFDLSHVYDIVQADSKKLRKSDGTGQLKVQKTKAGDMLPVDETIEPLRCGGLKKHDFPFEDDFNNESKGCKKDEDCDSTEACHKPKGKCFALCDLPNICGKGAICVADNHLLKCQCSPGDKGDPYIGCDDEGQDQIQKKADILDDEPQLFSHVNGTNNEYCFKAGDRRGNQHTILMSYHTLHVREHNRIATKLKEMNPHWDEEKLYQEARKINIAQYQVIVFNEFMPHLLGDHLMSQFGLWIQKTNARTKYNCSVDPAIVAEFSTAAYRLHTMVDFKVTLLAVEGFLKYSYLRNLYQNSALIYGGKMDHLLIAMGAWPYQKYDTSMATDVSQFLYKELRGYYGFDLAAVNVQRGRDNGIPPYVDVIKYLYDIKTEIKDFDDLLPYVDAQNIEKLKRVYCDARDIDLIIGLGSERIEKKMLIPTTAALIIAEQFQKLKVGDRFYFENEGQFTDEQLDTLKHASLSKLICDNTKLLHIQPRSMKFPILHNSFIPCFLLPAVDLQKWKEYTE